jgi:tRNA (guanine37-N1)-methyltransferase
MSPQGRPFSTAIARELSALPRIGLLCGRYEGVDERVREHLVSDQLSIGDYVLTGGELPALIVLDAVSRFLPGVLGDPDGAEDDSFANGLLEYPHYTRPDEFRGWKVPDILLSGNHAEIARWRREQSLLRTLKQRPELLNKIELDDKEIKFLKWYEKKEKMNEKVSVGSYVLDRFWVPWHQCSLADLQPVGAADPAGRQPGIRSAAH